MTLPPSYFDDLYSGADDPWEFRTRSYEARKRALTLDSFMQPHYGTIFEPGCSIGILTAGLASRADRVIAMDVAQSALDIAQAGLPDHVELRRGSLPHDWPEEPIDLVVLSEVAYYLDRPACAAMAERAVARGGEVIAVHWRHPVDDYPLSGDEVHAILNEAATAAGLAQTVAHLEEDFRLDVWCGDPRSVAARTGLRPA